MLLLSSIKKLLYIYFLTDVLEEASISSHAFQQDAYTITLSGDSLSRFMLGIEALKYNDGENLDWFLKDFIFLKITIF